MSASKILNELYNNNMSDDGDYDFRPPSALGDWLQYTACCISSDGIPRYAPSIRTSVKDVVDLSPGDKFEKEFIESKTDNNTYVCTKDLYYFCVNGVGGREGEGEYVERVYAVVKDGVFQGFAKITGSYYSYDGTTWDDELTDVTPKPVTVYEFN